MGFSPTRLREAREALTEHGRKVSQDRFAEMIGVSRRSPSRWENGVSEPRMAQLGRIAEVTGRPVDYFFDADQRAAGADNEMMADLLERLADGLCSQARSMRGDAELVG